MAITGDSSGVCYITPFSQTSPAIAKWREDECLAGLNRSLFFPPKIFSGGGSRDPKGGSPLHSLAGPGQQPSVAGNGPLGGAEAPNNPL